MIKYTDNEIVFQEFPDLVTLAINISNCQNRCVGCHSPELRGNIGTELTEDVLDELIEKNDGINCLGLMGEGNDKEALMKLARHVKDKYPWIKIGLYSGRNEVEDDIYELFDLVKVGPYIASCGPLNKETTNQRLYEMINGEKHDITYKFWRKLGDL